MCEKEDISSPPQAASVHVEYKAQPQGQQLPPVPKLSMQQTKYLQATSPPESVRHYQRELAQPGINGENYNYKFAHLAFLISHQSIFLYL